MRKTFIALLTCVFACALLVSCGSSSTTTQPSHITFRAFVSNPLHPTGTGGTFPALEVVDASKDVLSLSPVSLSGVMLDAGLLVVSPQKDLTMVVSPSSDRIAAVRNAIEMPVGAVVLPGMIESVLAAPDDTDAFVAIPNAAVSGQAAGEVGEVSVTTAAISAIIPVPSAHYMVPSPTFNQILVFSDNSNSVTLLFPGLINMVSQSNSQAPCSTAPVVACAISGFDRPVWGVFNSSGTTAYILNCGLECGGAGNASIVPLNMATQTAGMPIPLTGGAIIGATIGMLSGNLLYVAGTPSPSTPCGMGTAAQNCGVLSVVDVTSGAVTASQLIPDGYHDRMQMGANGQLFVGSHTCTNVLSASETRGCLAIYDTNRSTVVIPPQNGDVTGIEPIPNRNVVYVCQGGGLQIYDTTTDKLQTTQVNIVGQAIDVKVVDF